MQTWISASLLAESLTWSGPQAAVLRRSGLPLEEGTYKPLACNRCHVFQGYSHTPCALTAEMLAFSHFAVQILAFISVTSQSSAAKSGTFDLLTYNIAGLPSFLSDNGIPGDKATNTGTIGAKFAQYGYDVIHVQEVGTRLPYEPDQMLTSTGFCLPFRPLQGRQSSFSDGDIGQCPVRKWLEHAVQVQLEHT